MAYRYRRTSWIAAAGGLALLATQATCSEELTCEATSVAFALPQPDDELTMQAFVCVQPSEAASWSLFVELDDALPPDLQVHLRVVEPQGQEHQVAVTKGSLDQGPDLVEVSPAHCDEGVVVELRKGTQAPSVVATGWVHLTAEQEAAEVCQARFARRGRS